MAGQSKEKPHIKLIRGAQPPVWVCRGQGRWNGHGESPKAAYRDWGKDVGKSIDIGRYAGTYGGTLPHREVTSLAIWWEAEWGRILAGILAFILIALGIASAVMLWDAA